MNKILLFIFSFVIVFCYWNILQAENILSYTYPTKLENGYEDPSLLEYLRENFYYLAFEAKYSEISDKENSFFQKNKSYCLALLQTHQTWNDLRDCLAFWLLISPEDPELPHFFYWETQEETPSMYSWERNRTASRVWWEDSDNAFVRYNAYDKRFDLPLSFGKFTSDLEYRYSPPCISQDPDFPCFWFHSLLLKEKEDPYAYIFLGYDVSGEIMGWDTPFFVYDNIMSRYYTSDHKEYKNIYAASSWFSTPMNVAYFTARTDGREGSHIFYTEPLDQNLYNQVLPLVRKLLLKSENSESMKEQLKTMFTSCKTHEKTSALQLVCRKILSEELSK